MISKICCSLATHFYLECCDLRFCKKCTEEGRARPDWIVSENHPPSEFDGVWICNTVNKYVGRLWGDRKKFTKHLALLDRLPCLLNRCTLKPKGENVKRTKRELKLVGILWYQLQLKMLPNKFAEAGIKLTEEEMKVAQEAVETQIFYASRQAQRQMEKTSNEIST